MRITRVTRIKEGEKEMEGLKNGGIYRGGEKGERKEEEDGKKREKRNPN